MPTVSPLAHGEDWVAVETIIEERHVRTLLPQLKQPDPFVSATVAGELACEADIICAERKVA